MMIQNEYNAFIVWLCNEGVGMLVTSKTTILLNPNMF